VPDLVYGTFPLKSKLVTNSANLSIAAQHRKLLKWSLCKNFHRSGMSLT
jgi:hypothetical protein